MLPPLPSSHCPPVVFGPYGLGSLPTCRVPAAGAVWDSQSCVCHRRCPCACRSIFCEDPCIPVAFGALWLVAGRCGGPPVPVGQGWGPGRCHCHHVSCRTCNSIKLFIDWMVGVWACAHSLQGAQKLVFTTLWTPLFSIYFYKNNL